MTLNPFKLVFAIIFMVVINNNLKAQYILTDDDVEVTDGIITKCTYGFAIKDIIIPDTLDGQPVIGIDNCTRPVSLWNKKYLIAED